MTETVVIVGAGQAGGWVARTLRAQGHAGPVTLIGAEPHAPYERPPLSKAVLVGAAPPDSTRLFAADDFEALDLDFRAGMTVVGLDRTARSVTLSSGETVRYDRLVLATGGRARTLPIAGMDSERVYTLRTLEDSHAIGAALKTARKALLVGGGWIGLEIAASARKLETDVVLLEAADRLCQRAAPPLLSDWLLALHCSHGVDVRLRSGIEAIEPTAGGITARLADGSEVGAELAVVGVGLVANDDLARSAGLACDGGILTDACGRTEDPSVFACGDVAVFPVLGAAHPMRLESWANAQNQAVACAKAVLGQDVEYADTPWFWSDQYDANIQIQGLPPQDGDPIVRGDVNGPAFSLFWLDGDKVAAAMAVNASNDIKVAKRLIDRGIAVDAAALSDPGVNLKTLLRG